ncbi:MAG: heat-shock protein [Methylococcaceae bacterium]|nr:heat-shock protein [Methylococcaceae bacterium]
MEKFNTVEEITSWRSFVFEGKVYDLSHLNAHTAEYTDDSKGRTYKYIVTYSFHCFAKENPLLSAEDSKLLLYKTRKENRHFNFERYELSKHLPCIILSLGSKETVCFHAGHSRFANYKVNDDKGNTINYFVVFKSFKEKKRLRLHIESAYPVSSSEKVKMKKINFFVIAYNTLMGKSIQKPKG